jgi:hypothetical protein
MKTSCLNPSWISLKPVSTFVAFNSSLDCSNQNYLFSWNIYPLWLTIDHQLNSWFEHSEVTLLIRLWFIRYQHYESKSPQWVVNSMEPEGPKGKKKTCHFLYDLDFQEATPPGVKWTELVLISVVQWELLLFCCLSWGSCIVPAAQCDWGCWDDILTQVSMSRGHTRISHFLLWCRMLRDEVWHYSMMAGNNIWSSYHQEPNYGGRKQYLELLPPGTKVWNLNSGASLYPICIQSGCIHIWNKEYPSFIQSVSWLFYFVIKATMAR